MPQQKQVSWAELRVGLFVLAGTALLVVVIFYVTGGGFLSPKYRLHTYLPEVDGLTTGAPVRLDGVDIGSVENISVAMGNNTPELKVRSIRVDLRIERKYEDYIRADSTAGMVTEGLLGNRYVDINRGFVGNVLTNNDEIPGRQNKELSAMIETSADVLQSLKGITDKVNTMIDNVQSGKGTIGKLVTNDELYNSVSATTTNLNQMVSNIKQGQGSLGKLVASDELYNNTQSAAARLDNILEEVQTQQGTLGKLIYDPQFHDSALKLVDNSNGFFGDVRAGKGTLGKLATDDSLFTEYKQIGANLDSATAKLNSSQSTLGQFFVNPQLYDNLSSLTGDMRLLVGDFRSNPKKFLHVKFSLF